MPIDIIKYKESQKKYQMVYRRNKKLQLLEQQDSNMCICGTLTCDMIKHLKSERHYTNMMALNLDII